MKTIVLFTLVLAGSASARELDAMPSYESARVVPPARAHDERTPSVKEGTVDAKYDVAFPTYDRARSRMRGSI